MIPLTSDATLRHLPQRHPVGDVLDRHTAECTVPLPVLGRGTVEYKAFI